MTIEWKEMPKKNPGHGGRWVEGGAVADGLRAAPRRCPWTFK